jgi:hypothetical protein
MDDGMFLIFWEYLGFIFFLKIDLLLELHDR